MRSINVIKKSTVIYLWIWLLLSLILIFAFAGITAGKSLYVIANHHTGQFDAYDIASDGTVEYQDTYDLQHAMDPAGLVSSGCPPVGVIFITSEFNPGVELVDATTMESLGYVDGPTNLAGIDFDNANNLIYTVLRATDDLYVYRWNDIARTLTLEPGYPTDLPGCVGAFGISLDDTRGILWVADAAGGIARAYDISTLTEDPNLSFEPVHSPVDIVVDRVREFVYTVSITPGCSPNFGGSTLLSQWDPNSETERLADMGHGGVGVAVDEITGYVYVTGGCDGDTLEVWDCNTEPFTQIQNAGVIGNPAGVWVPRTEVGYSGPCSEWYHPPVRYPLAEDTYVGWDERSDNLVPVMVADDFFSDSNKPLTAIRWWGSFIDWNEDYIPDQNLPEAFYFTIWTDTPAGSEPCEPVIKWEQLPDLSDMGMDVSVDYCGHYAADDFECRAMELITHISIWASWYEDTPPSDDANNVIFTLRIYTNDPCGPSGRSEPNELLWEKIFQPAEFEVLKYAEDLNEGYCEPCMDFYEPNTDSICWQYDFYIDPCEALIQEGEPCDPVVYWLAVKAELPLGEEGFFGWKTAQEQWNDTAVYGDGDEWWPMFYPHLHPYEPNLMDLAFAINPELPESVPYSHPNEVIWEYYCDINDVNINFFGWEYDPRIVEINEAKFSFYHELDICDYLLLNDSNGIYWLGIMAIYDGNEPEYPWGWETRSHCFQDVAVRLQDYPVKGKVYSGIEFEPIDDEGFASDLTFELFSPNEPNYSYTLRPLDRYLKWSQPVIEIDPEVKPPVYCGWDEPSLFTSENEPVKIVADDFRCVGSAPITYIRWFGSYVGWPWPTGTCHEPIGWHIGFWSNVPAPDDPHQDPNYSYPETLLWKLQIDANRVDVKWAGLDQSPDISKPNDSCFEYYLELRPEEYFIQNNYTDLTLDNVYWISITAIYPNDVNITYPWGWKTRPTSWMDDAVTIIWPDLPQVGYTLSPYDSTPIKYDCNSLDMSFELGTDPNWIKWEQSFTGMFDWLDYNDVNSFAIEDEGELTADQWAADDWSCVRRTPVTSAVWWGVYKRYNYKPCQHEPYQPPIKPKYFLLSVWTDVPDTNISDPCTYSHPGKKIWEYKAYDYDEVFLGNYINAIPDCPCNADLNGDGSIDIFDLFAFKNCLGQDPEGICKKADLNCDGYIDEDDEEILQCQWGGVWPHQECCGIRKRSIYRYSVRLPRGKWFNQPNYNGIFWFSVVAVYENINPQSPPANFYEWGWLNHFHNFNDDAVSGISVGPYEWVWQEVHDITGATADLSFMLFTDPEECVSCADYVTDGFVNFIDYTDFADDWGWIGQQGGYNNSDLNCSGTVDFDDVKLFAEQWLSSCWDWPCFDTDGDGYGNPPTPCCPNPQWDCNDTNPNVYPGAVEICDNGIDDDCDNKIDCLDTDCRCPDADGDGYGAQLNPCCDYQGIDCNDANPATHPGAEEICDGEDNDCDGSIDNIDKDGDSYYDELCGGDDCNDNDPNINPGVAEICDGLDNNCDQMIDNIDMDGDGYYDAMCGWDDCNDADPNINPGEEEIWDDGVDNDCDGLIDCNDPDCTCIDLDGDDFGALSRPCCPNQGIDCNDNNPDVYPGAPEICDGEDNDCDTIIDNVDNDEDGYIDEDCGGEDCNDSNPNTYPGAPEICDGEDNDCDGTIDNVDMDEDGFIDAMCGGNDCDDTDPNVNPDAEEICDDLKDNDCDELTDCEDVNDCTCIDVDGDGYGPAGSYCCPNAGIDCNDNDPNINPGAEEICDDGIDNDCDGQADANDLDDCCSCADRNYDLDDSGYLDLVDITIMTDCSNNGTCPDGTDYNCDGNVTEIDAAYLAAIYNCCKQPPFNRCTIEEAIACCEDLFE